MKNKIGIILIASLFSSCASTGPIRQCTKKTGKAFINGANAVTDVAFAPAFKLKGSNAPKFCKVVGWPVTTTIALGGSLIAIPVLAIGGIMSSN